MNNNINFSSQQVPRTLKIWFVIHFFTDIAFAIPLMFFPEQFLKLFGWQTVDPIATRLVAAALFGIGIESFLGRNAGVESYKGMLNLKVIWSSFAIIGISVSLLAGAQGEPIWGWIIFTIFLLFNVNWVYWRLKLRNI